MSAINIIDWRPLRKGALLGFAKIELPSGMLISDVTILQSDRGAWASPPAKPMVGRDGVVLTDDGGKTKYVPIIEFATKAIRDKFSAAVVDALRAAHPGAFAS